MKNNWFIYLIIFVGLFILVRECQPEPKIKIETVTEYVKVTDTITNTIIEKVPTKVYVNRYVNVKGNDSIVFVTTPNDSTIQANQYNTKLESNNATATLKITTTGELLDVSGVIDYTQENTTTTITKTKAQSGLFLYGETSLEPMFNRFELGLDYQIKNTIIIGTSVGYDNLSEQLNFNVKIGIRIF